MASSWLKLASRWPKMASSWPKMTSCCLELAQVGLKLAQVGSKLAPSWLKLDPRSAQGASRKLSWGVLGGSRQDSGRHLEPRGPPGGPRGAKMSSR